MVDVIVGWKKSWLVSIVTKTAVSPVISKRASIWTGLMIPRARPHRRRLQRRKAQERSVSVRIVVKLVILKQTKSNTSVSFVFFPAKSIFSILHYFHILHTSCYVYPPTSPKANDGAIFQGSAQCLTVQ